MPRVLLIVIAVLAALYGGYWVVGSRAVERGARAALDGLAARGWTVAYDGVSTGGFPSRFDTTLAEPRIASPDGSVAWEAPFVQAFALSYRPNRVIAVWPDAQRLRLGPLDLDLRSQRLRASGGVRLGSDLAFADATMEADGLAMIDASSGYALEAGRVVAAMRDAGAQPTTYDVSLVAADLLGGLMTEAADLWIEATAELDRPLDRRLAEAPRLLSLRLDEATVTVGEGAGLGELRASGTLVVAPDGTPEGEIRLAARNWDAVIAAARGAGLIDEGLAVFYRRFLDEAAGGDATVELPLVFANGGISALGLPVGSAPSFGPQRQ